MVKKIIIVQMLIKTLDKSDSISNKKEKEIATATITRSSGC